MKKSIISTVLVLAVLSSFAFEKKEEVKKKVVVPEVVLKAFAAQQAGATKVKWDEEKPGEFEAEFVMNKNEMSVLYDAKGTLLETEMEIKEAELPQAVKATIAKDLSGYKLDEIEKANAKGVVTYEMEAVKDKKEFELVFDNSGKLLKKEELKKEKNEEKD